MEQYLQEKRLSLINSETAQRKWRKAVSLVKNSRRRFRHIPDLDKREKTKKSQENLRLAFTTLRAAFRFENGIPGKARAAGFRIHPDEIAYVVRSHDIKALKSLGGVEGVARKVGVSLDKGVESRNLSIRQDVYGFNRYTEKPPKSFFKFLWEALLDSTLIILIVCDVLVSIAVGLATDGWPKCMYDGLGILLSILLGFTVIAVRDYKQSLQFRDLDKEKKKIIVHITRDGSRQKILIHDLVVGDVVHLSIGDQVPADGIFVSGYSLLIDESSLSGESEYVAINEQKPFLLAGTKVQDGSAKMLVTAVGMRTEWGKLMETLGEGGEDVTPLQVKLKRLLLVYKKGWLVGRPGEKWSKRSGYVSSMDFAKQVAFQRSTQDVKRLKEALDETAEKLAENSKKDSERNAYIQSLYQYMKACAEKNGDPPPPRPPSFILGAPTIENTAAEDQAFQAHVLFSSRRQPRHAVE